MNPLSLTIEYSVPTPLINNLSGEIQKDFISRIGSLLGS